MDNQVFMSKAKPGDVLLYRIVPGVGFASWLVGFGERILGDQKKLWSYSHAQLYTGNGSEVEATWPRIREVAVDAGRLGLEIWRPKNVDDVIIANAIAFARSKIGVHYDLGYLISLGLIKSKHEYVCSELVVESYKFSNVNILGDPDPLESPDDIAQSRVMELVATA